MTIDREDRSREADPPALAWGFLGTPSASAATDGATNGEQQTRAARRALDRPDLGDRLEAIARRAWVALSSFKPKRAVVIAVPAALCAVLLAATAVKVHLDAIQAEGDAAGYVAPRIVVHQPTRADVVLIGVTTPGETRTGLAGLAAGLHSMLNVPVTSLGSSDAFVSGGTSRTSFGGRVRQIDADAAVVVFMSNPKDASSSALRVAASTTKVLAAARSRAPRATLVLLGPASLGSASPAQVNALRTVLRTSADITKSDFIDPIKRAWVPKMKKVLSASDDGSVTAALAASLAAILDGTAG